MKFWNFKKEEKALYIYGEIASEKWFDEDVTPNEFKKELDALGDVDEISIYINSVGGDVFAAQAMVSMLDRHKAKKHVYIDGLAASAATFPLTIADKITIADRGMIMIHNAWSAVMGNAKDMLGTAALLEKIDNILVAGYVKVSGKTEEEVRDMMAKETWLTASEAIESGFAHESTESLKVAAKVKDDKLIVNNVEIDADKFKYAAELKETYRAVSEPEPVVIDLAEQRKQFNEIKNKIFGGTHGTI